MRMTDTRLLIISITGIIVVALLSVLLTPSPDRLLSDNESSQGTRSLRLWLEQSGYDVNPITRRAPDLDDLDTLFLINPYLLERAELSRLREWVRQGGTLILAGYTAPMDAFLDFYGLSTRYLDSEVQVSTTAPTLTNPPFDQLILRRVYGLEGWESGEVLIHAESQGVPVVVSLSDRRGRIWYVGSAYPFTNRGLRETASARLILNLLTPPPASIGFSEGLFESGQTLFDWLVGTSPGWGILSGLGLTYVYVALRGRRFGAPVPLLEERLRREPFEYIRAMALLFRHSGERAEILQHYHRQVRRRLIQRYALDATLSDKALTEKVTQHDANVDGAALAKLLQALSRQRVNEAELLRVAQSADEWLKRSE
jgi:hypothetical protein